MNSCKTFSERVDDAQEPFHSEHGISYTRVRAHHPILSSQVIRSVGKILLCRHRTQLFSPWSLLMIVSRAAEPNTLVKCSLTAFGNAAFSDVLYD